MDAIRKQLDQLMGANRNGDVREVSRKYYDRDVCRLFLAGLCPHDLFQLTVRSPCYSRSPRGGAPSYIPTPSIGFGYRVADVRLRCFVFLQKMDMGPCPKLHSLQLRKEYPWRSPSNYSCRVTRV
jgi:hypothetical protein